MKQCKIFEHRPYTRGVYCPICEERQRIISHMNDIINSVVDYGLNPAQYDRAVKGITEIINGEPDA